MIVASCTRIKNKSLVRDDVFLVDVTLEKGAKKPASIHAPPSGAKNCAQETLTTHNKGKHIHACQKKSYLISPIVLYCSYVLWLIG